MSAGYITVLRREGKGVRHWIQPPAEYWVNLRAVFRTHPEKVREGIHFAASELFRKAFTDDYAPGLATEGFMRCRAFILTAGLVGSKGLEDDFEQTRAVELTVGARSHVTLRWIGAEERASIQGLCW